MVGGTDTTGVDGASSIFYDSAEIYDPATSTWTATGSLTTGGRALHTLAMLYGGRTLITGGYNGSAVLSSAEIYNLNTGTFSATRSMKMMRAQHSADFLFDGRVLITGGVIDPGGTPSNTAEIYDPVMGTFSETAGPMASARYAHRMVTVGDGKVLVTGGFGAGGAELATAELFDPATGTFSPAGSLAQARANHSATELPTGEILVAGGYGGGGVLGSTEIYNPDSKTFRAGPTLNQARQVHSAWPIPNGLLLISGGNNNASGFWDIQTSFLSSAELYNPAINSFTTTGSKNNATSGGNSYLLWTGKLLAVGGGTNEAELYTPEMPGTPETWVATTNMQTPRANSNFFNLDDGRVLMVGGLNSSGNPLASAELYDYLNGNFYSTGSMSTPRQHHYGVGLYTGKVLVTGGRPSASANVLNSAELYDPVSGTFTSTGNMHRYRRLHKATALPDGKILITGGFGGTSETATNYLSSAELYDPATGTFSFTTGALNIARYNHIAYLLYTGKVLIAGGVGSGSVVLNSAELYDPETDTFTAAGNMITARNNPLVTALPNGKILVSSGVDATGTPIQAIEIYDPATGTFTAAGNGLVARYYNRVTRLANGKLIFVGGQTTANTSSVTNSADLYNHVTGKFSPTGSLITGRRNFAQWSLPNGRILVAGGYDASGTMLSSAELYTPLIGDVFSDVPINYWAYDYIASIYNVGITKGCAQDDPNTPENERRYCPEDNVTREQMAAFIVRAVEGEPPLNYCDSGDPFPDVTPDMFFCRYIKRLYERGITTGYSDGTYGPNNNVSREEMATFIVRAVEGEPPLSYCMSGSPFPDVTPDMWSCIYIKRLKELEITTGYGDGRYGPYDLVTRAQMAAFLSRAFLGME